MEIKKFLSAFFGENDDICFRVFSDRKAEEPEYKGNKYTEQLKNIDTLLPTLKQHNKKNRGVFFVINSGGHSDSDITRINAQFVEMDSGSFKEQQAKIDAFPLPPSIIVKTRKSLHCYWLMKDAKVSRFREIQLRLVKRFDGDPMCQNESRVLRLPGFFHCKSDLIKVECLKFNPELRYTQEKLSEYLPDVEFSACNTDKHEKFKGEVGSGQRILDKCAFCRYCSDNAESLPEPMWYAMVSNISLAKDGAALVHEISRPYPRYKRAETDEKIRHAITENKPHTCEYIQKTLGFSGCTDCKVKSPVVHAVLTLAEQAEELAESEISDDEIFEDRTIDLMAYAKKNAPAVYGKFKLKIKGRVSIRDFEAAIRHKEKSASFAIIEDSEMPLNLTDINLGGASCPSNWDVSMEKGIRKSIAANGGSMVVTVCPSPIVISRRFESVDNFGEKVELSFYRDNRWKRFIAPRSAVFNKSSLIGFADRGLPVSSANSGDIVAYLSDYENTNVSKIPLLKSTERMGWLDSTSFFPYTAPKEICFETDYEDSNEIHKNLAECGSFEKWLDAATKMRENPFGRFMLASSFASVLLEPLSHRVFFINVWHDTTSGKSAACKMAVSVWGNPLKLMGSFNATAVGLERKADTLRHILYGLDERQLANESRLPMAQIVYGLANGFGRIRGHRDGGIQSMTNWRLIVLSTAEEPLLRDDSHDGMNTRVMELHGKPVDDKLFAAELHHISEKNYGFAGKMFIERLCKEISCKQSKITEDYAKIVSVLKRKYPVVTHLENAAVIALGDYYSDMWIWNADENIAFEKAVNTAASMLENNISLEKEDIIDRAWQHVTDWCVANDRAFGDDAPVRFGLKEGASRYYVLKFALDDALQKKNYPIEKCMTGFFERGYLQRWGGKRQKQKKVGGTLNWYYVVDVPESNEGNNIVPLS
jgi:putative DNA primase/helicase